MSDDAYSKRLALEKLALGAATKARETAKANAEKRRRKAKSAPRISKGEGSVRKLEFSWRERMSAMFPFANPPRWWTQIEDTEKGKPGKEAGLVSQLVRMYSEERIRKYLTWGVEHWGEVSALLPGKAIPYEPSIAVLFTFRETLLPRAMGAA